MSTRYFDESVRTLKRAVSPRLQLMSVEKPTIEVSPTPLTSHSVEGFPGLQFSAMILFAGLAHGSTGAAGAVRPRVCALVWTPITPTSSATVATQRKT